MPFVPILAKFPKTNEYMTVENKGLITNHSGPKMVCLYCVVKSLFTNSHIRSRYRITSLNCRSSSFLLGLSTKLQSPSSFVVSLIHSAFQSAISDRWKLPYRNHRLLITSRRISPRSPYTLPLSLRPARHAAASPDQRAGSHPSACAACHSVCSYPI